MIDAFSATPDAVANGAATEFTWTWSYANAPTPEPSCSVDQSVGIVTNGSTTSQSLAQDTTFTLTCTNAAGSDTAQATVTLTAWMFIDSGTSAWLRDVTFVDSSTGWVVGDGGTILKTVDAGIAWAPQTSNVSHNLNDVHFIDANNGWVVGDSATLIQTTDGGSSWTSLTVPVTKRLEGVCFLDSNTGWVSGDGGALQATTDGGNSWSGLFASHVTDVFYDIHFFDANAGVSMSYNATTQNARRARTSDGGATWGGTSLGNDRVSGMFFVDGTTGWIVGSNVIFKSTSSGFNWVSTSVPGSWYGVHFADANTGWAVGLAGAMVKTTDGGDNWVPLTSGTLTAFNAVYFADVNTGWVVGRDGAIFKTESGG